jgi:hypothetical protein
MKLNPEDYFYLSFEKGDTVGDERGRINYGDEKYIIRFLGDREPYLQIKLDQRNKDDVRTRVVRGRNL